MPSLIDKLIQGMGDVKSPIQKQQAQEKELATTREPRKAELERVSDMALEESAKNLVRKLAVSIEPLVPLAKGKTQADRAKEMSELEAKIRFGQRATATDVMLNPITGTAKAFAVESLPYLAGGKLYQKGADIGAKAFAKRYGENLASKSAGVYAGTAPVTLGIDVLQDRTADEMIENQMFDALLSPAGGFLHRIKPDIPDVPTPTPEPIRQEMVFTPEEMRESGIPEDQFTPSGSDIEPDSKRFVLETADGKDIVDMLEDGVPAPLNSILKTGVKQLEDSQVVVNHEPNLAEPFDVYKEGNEIQILYKDELTPEMKRDINQAVLQHESQHFTRTGTSPEQIKAASEKYDIDQVTEYGKTFDTELEPKMREAGNTPEEIMAAKEDIINEAIYRNQSGEMLARETERIETGREAIGDTAVNPYVDMLAESMLAKKPQGEVIIGRPKEPVRMEAKVTPKKAVTGETIDMVNKNNYDTAVLKNDVHDILKDMGIKPQSKIMKEIEAAIAGSTSKVIKLPKTDLGRKVHTQLMKLDKYRLQEQFIMPEKMANKLNKGLELNAHDIKWLNKNKKFLSEKERKALSNLEDIDALKSGKTPFDKVIEIMNKYESDSAEFPAMTPEIKDFYKRDAKWFRKMRGEVIATIKSDMKQAAMKDEGAVATKEITPDTAVTPEKADVLETAEDRALAKSKRQKSRRTKDVSDMTPAEKAMHEKGQKDYIFKDEGKKKGEREKEKIEFEKAAEPATVTPEAKPKEAVKKPVEPEPKKEVERDYKNLSPADKRWMDKYDTDAKKLKNFTKATQAKRARLLEEMKTPRVKKPSRAEELQAMSDENIPIGMDADEWAKQREAKWKGEAEKDKYEGMTDEDIAELDRIQAEDPFVEAPKKDENLEKFVQEKRDNVTREFGADREQMRGEVGKESTEFIPSADNKATKIDAESSEIFSAPETMHIEFTDGDMTTGYMAAQQTFMKTMLGASTGFNTYVHESFHKVFGNKKLEDIIKAFEEDYHGDIPDYDNINMELNYSHDNPIFTYEENIVFAATDLFISKLPADVIERLQIDLAPINKRLERLEKLTPNMQKLANELSDMGDKAMKHKENYLNEFAYGQKERTFDMLDRYGEAVIERGIDALTPILKQIDDKASTWGAYGKAKSYANELIANVMSQANKLPAQKFIDKFTSISRATEERGKNFANITSGEIKKMFPDKKTRTQLTKTVMKKDVQVIKDEILSVKTYDDFLALRKQNKKEVALFLSNDINKKVKQLIRSFSDDAAMNSIHWKHNAYEILMDHPQFRKMIQTGDKAKALEIVHAMDKHITMEAVSLNDFNFMKSLDPKKLEDMLIKHQHAVKESKEAMARPSSSYIKGYKPSLFKNYVEFTSKPTYKYVTKDAEGKKDRFGAKIKVLDGWVKYSDDLYYREAIRPDAASGMMTSKQQVPKGTVMDDVSDIHNLQEYAEQHGYGIITVDGESKLRKVVGKDIREQVLNENMDIAENMASLIENNVHDKVTGKHDVDMLNEFNKHDLIVSAEVAATKEGYSPMTPKELSLLPKRIKDALVDSYGKDGVYINNKYKEQMIGYSHDIGAIHHLSKSGIEITHKMLMNEAKMLDMVTETTQLLKQTLILKNPVVILGNYVFQSIVANLEGVPMKNIAKYQKESLADFSNYTKLTERKIKLQINGKEGTKEYKALMKELESNVAYVLFQESKDGGGIDRNLLIKALREKNMDRKHMEKWFTKILGGEDHWGYKTASELFITPESKVGSLLIRGLNHVDYMGRSTLMRHYLKQGKSMEDAARLANSKTVSFSKQLPSSTAWLERYGFDHFLTWTLRNSMGLGVSMKEHPARWLMFAALYEALSDEDKQRHDAHYVGNVRVSSFNPSESVMSSMLDGGIYSHIADKGAMSFEPELIRKIREDKNPVVTTR